MPGFFAFCPVNAGPSLRERGFHVDAEMKFA
jgi:hypothetical protein